tara:strand:- start:841 stop:1305 length:465 start_codon:yes stop_codon:yes gene_type:complete
MLKKIFLLTMFLFVSSCGYEPLYSKKNLSNNNFSINEIQFVGDRQVNLHLKNSLSNYIINKKNRNYDLEVNSELFKTTIAKNAKGNPTIFNLSIKVSVHISKDDIFLEKLSFDENFKYDLNDDKFQMKEYEKDIKRNLTEIIKTKIINKMSNFK